MVFSDPCRESPSGESVAGGSPVAVDGVVEPADRVRMASYLFAQVQPVEPFAIKECGQLGLLAFWLSPSTSPY